jgi:riboflavin-specific deaminase-like protein
MMVMSLDGSAWGPDGLSGSISSPTDRRVFAEARRLCDAVLVGAGTIRAERYRPMIAKSEHAQARSAAGLAPAPVVVIVSGSLDLPWEEPLFADSTMRVVIATCADRSLDGADRLAIAREHAEVLVMPGSTVDVGMLVAELHSRGLKRIVCEGGPRLLRDVAAAGLIDEVDMSISPVLVGGGQVVTGEPLPVAVQLDLAHTIAADGFVFCRYLRRS